MCESRAWAFTFTSAVIACVSGCGLVAPPDDAAGLPADAVLPDVGSDATLSEVGTDASVPEVGSDTSVADAFPDVVVLPSDGTWSWRPVGGPPGIYYPYGFTFHASGDEILAASAYRIFRTTGLGWTDLGLGVPLDGVAGTRAKGGFLWAARGAIYALSGTSWTKRADCPPGGCLGRPMELESGTLLLVDFGWSSPKGVRRLAATETSWSTLAVPPPSPYSYPASTAGARVVLGRFVSLDDGATFTELGVADLMGNAYATSAGVVAVRQVPSSTSPYPVFDGVWLRTDDGSWSRAALPDVFKTGAELVAAGNRVFVRSGTQLARSLDGGLTWTVATASAPDGTLVAATPSRLVISRNTALAISFDDGASFSNLAVPSRPAVDAFALRGSSPAELWTSQWDPLGFVYYVAPFRSTDDGKSWEPQPVVAGPSKEEAFSGPGATFLYAEPSSLTVFVSSTRLTRKLSSGVWTDCSVLGPIVGEAGKLLARGSLSTDSGATWSKTAGYGGGFDATGMAYVASGADILRSPDGAAWTKVGNAPSGRFLVGRNGWFYGVSADGVFRSSDAGGSWSAIAASTWPTLVSVLPIGPKSTLVIPRTDPSKGYFSILMSEDGGATFVDRTLNLPQVPLSAIVSMQDSLVFEGNGHVWAALPEHGLFELVPKP